LSKAQIFINELALARKINAFAKALWSDSPLFLRRDFFFIEHDPVRFLFAVISWCHVVNGFQHYIVEIIDFHFDSLFSS
jgi:hypothetical protein